MYIIILLLIVLMHFIKLLYIRCHSNGYMFVRHIKHPFIIRALPLNMYVLKKNLISPHCCRNQSIGYILFFCVSTYKYLHICEKWIHWTFEVYFRQCVLMQRYSYSYKYIWPSLEFLLSFRTPEFSRSVINVPLSIEGESDFVNWPQTQLIT